MTKKTNTGMAWGAVPIAMLLDKRIGLQPLRVFIAISSFQGRGIDCWASREAVSERAGVHPVNVSKATSILEACGWIEIERKGFNRSCQYAVKGLAGSTNPGATDLAGSTNKDLVDLIPRLSRIDYRDLADPANTDLADPAKPLILIENTIVKTPLENTLRKQGDGHDVEGADHDAGEQPLSLFPPDVTEIEITDPVFDIAITSDGDVPILISKIEEWQKAYPQLDVRRNVVRACQHLRDNQEKPITARGVANFVGKWLGRQSEWMAEKQRKQSEKTDPGLRRKSDYGENLSEYERLNPGILAAFRKARGAE